MDDKLLTIGQTAEKLGISIDTLRRWDESGKLVAIRKDGGTHRYYREKDLEVFRAISLNLHPNGLIMAPNSPVLFIAKTVLDFKEN